MVIRLRPRMIMSTPPAHEPWWRGWLAKNTLYPFLMDSHTQEGCVRFLTRRHLAHPVSVLILRPGEVQALWWQNYDAETLKFCSKESRQYNEAITSYWIRSSKLVYKVPFRDVGNEKSRGWRKLNRDTQVTQQQWVTAYFRGSMEHGMGHQATTAVLLKGKICTSSQQGLLLWVLLFSCQRIWIARIVVVPVVSSAIARHCIVYSAYCIPIRSIVSLCRVFFHHRACISLAGRIGTDSGCTGCRRVERKNLLMWRTQTLRGNWYCSFHKKLKNISCEYDWLNGWNSTFASCVVHQTRSLDVL